jgi:hypothetical protein
MKLWCKVMATMLALLWLPVTSHCLLETAEIIHHDHCCEQPFGTGHSHGHDAADGTCQVESRQMPGQKHEVLKTVVLIAVLSLNGFDFPNQPAVQGIVFDGVAPPELVSSWQFVCRAAVSPRAPSILL